jgi:AhpD family alkylhydroperoxidase
MDEISARIDFEKVASGVYGAISRLDGATTKLADEAGLEPPLRELIRIRASQLNGCAYCVDMHTKDARKGGESEQRLYAVAVWRETPFFSERERAALAFTEVVTLMADTHVPSAAWEEAAAVFSEPEMAAVLSLILTINAWNTIGVSTRAWAPGSYEP